MIPLSAATRVFIVTGPTDMRKSFNGLYGIIAQQLGQDPVSGHVFVFCNRPHNRIKILFWDGSGLWVCAKRLEKGSFSWDWPSEGSPCATLAHEQLAMLLGGVDLRGTRMKRWHRITGQTKAA